MWFTNTINYTMSKVQTNYVRVAAADRYMHCRDIKYVALKLSGFLIWNIDGFDKECQY